MDFTEIYKQTSGLVASSPQDARYILIAIENRLIVRRSDTFQITHAWTVEDKVDSGPSSQKGTTVGVASTMSASGDTTITGIGWSSDSRYILACSAGRGAVNVFSLLDEAWTARIQGGVEGIVKAEWAPEGRNIVCFSDWTLRVTIWSLSTGKATYIQYPKYGGKCFAFVPGSNLFILAERHKSKDSIGIYDTSSGYQLLRHFPVLTQSLSSLCVSTNEYIAISENTLEFKVYIYNFAGILLGTFLPEEEAGMGVRHMSWHPSGTVLAVSGWSDKIYLLNHFNWAPISIIEFRARIPAETIVWKEPVGWFEATHGRGFLPYDRVKRTMIARDTTGSASTGGCLQMEWNIKGTGLLVIWENSPTAVHVYQNGEKIRPQLGTVLLHSNAVICAAWNPVKEWKLGISCGGCSIYTWWKADGDGEIGECIGVPAKKFSVKELRWTTHGNGFLLVDKHAFACAFEVEDD
ncbi:YVTN repeat-like/Quino protein amine dehydrogenase [Cantharellus anzutake]|uniref:YVTN repeat-like/Quino protein amine dehydrogenase n=1 Tax=Cantharellus anzutake TaxID=1750568 RepID=UPI00190549DD|nr:YVTN repeat-like/Quino protein amine dehydrogenase [Cantharellus anzutake]KAF8328154.1 YVTN repeat-like/Quino protein amine dehydrogenase [Cantharellus anzutake]